MTNYWTTEDIEMLREYADRPLKEQAKLLNRTVSALSNKRAKLGISKPKPRWTEEEIEFLRNNYQQMTDNDLEQKLGRSAHAIMEKRHKLGLHHHNAKPWTQKELELVKSKYQDLTNEELGQLIGRTSHVVISMKQKLGLTQTQKRWTNADIQFLKSNLDLTDQELADHLNTTISSVDNKRRRLGLSKQEAWTEKDKQFILENMDDLSDNQLAKRLNRTRRSVQHKRIDLDLYRQHQDSHEVNEDFFKTWTSEMAYILGFIFGDGYIRSKLSNYQLVFSSTDRSLLVKIRDVMDSTNPITKDKKKRKPTHKIKYHLRIYRKKIIKDLQKLGVTNNKSLDMKYPQIPDEYFFDFVRGYMDADGHVNHRSGLYTLMVSASEDFIKTLSQELEKRGIENSVYFQENETNGIYQLYIKKKGREKFFTKLYENSTIHLQRKKDIVDHYYTNIIMIECQDCGKTMKRRGSNHKRCQDCAYLKKLEYDAAYRARKKHGSQKQID